MRAQNANEIQTDFLKGFSCAKSSVILCIASVVQRAHMQKMFNEPQTTSATNKCLRSVSEQYHTKHIASQRTFISHCFHVSSLVNS